MKTTLLLTATLAALLTGCTTPPPALPLPDQHEFYQSLLDDPGTPAGIRAAVEKLLRERFGDTNAVEGEGE